MKHPTGIGSDTVRDYSESVRLARRSGQKAGLRKGVVYRASNGDTQLVYEARAHGLEALCSTVQALSRRAGGCYRVEDIRDGETVALFANGERIAWFACRTYSRSRTEAAARTSSAVPGAFSQRQQN